MQKPLKFAVLCLLFGVISLERCFASENTIKPEEFTRWHTRKAMPLGWQKILNPTYRKFSNKRVLKVCYHESCTRTPGGILKKDVQRIKFNDQIPDPVPIEKRLEKATFELAQFEDFLALYNEGYDTWKKGLRKIEDTSFFVFENSDQERSHYEAEEVMATALNILEKLNFIKLRDQTSDLARHPTWYRAELKNIMTMRKQAYNELKELDANVVI